MKRVGFVFICLILYLTASEGQENTMVLDTIPETKVKFWESALSELRTNQLEMKEEDIIRKID